MNFSYKYWQVISNKQKVKPLKLRTSILPCSISEEIASSRKNYDHYILIAFLMKLQELIEEYLTDRDLKEVLDNLNFNHSGSKKELFERVLNGIDGKSAKEVLSLFSSEVLIRICKAKGIEQDWPFFRDSDEQMIKKICSGVLDKDESKLESNQSKKQMELPSLITEAQYELDKRFLIKSEIKVISSPSRTNSSFEEVVKGIEEWLPRISYNSEDGYRADLNPWLWSRGHHTRMSKGDSTVYILVDNKYPIEVIMEPKLSDFHRAFGQIHRHLERFQSVIMVICHPKHHDELEYFEERVRRSLTYNNRPYKIIKKN
jgi:hypothetical protein